MTYNYVIHTYACVYVGCGERCDSGLLRKMKWVRMKSGGVSHRRCGGQRKALGAGALGAETPAAPVLVEITITFWQGQARPKSDGEDRERRQKISGETERTSRFGK